MPSIASTLRNGDILDLSPWRRRSLARQGQRGQGRGLPITEP